MGISSDTMTEEMPAARQNGINTVLTIKPLRKVKSEINGQGTAYRDE